MREINQLEGRKQQTLSLPSDPVRRTQALAGDGLGDIGIGHVLLAVERVPGGRGVGKEIVGLAGADGGRGSETGDAEGSETAGPHLRELEPEGGALGGVEPARGVEDGRVRLVDARGELGAEGRARRRRRARARAVVQLGPELATAEGEVLGAAAARLRVEQQGVDDRVGARRVEALEVRKQQVLLRVVRRRARRRPEVRLLVAEKQRRRQLWRVVAAARAQAAAHVLQQREHAA